MIELRDYQAFALDRLRSNLSAGCLAQVLQLATGGGKTAIASAVARSAVGRGNRVFFIVDSIELVDQALGRFVSDGLECGVIQADHHMTDYGKPVQVATIQTLKRRWSDLPDSLLPSVVIIDECHVFHEAHEKIVRQCKHMGIAVIGLSATPFRKGLGKYFDKLVVGATTKNLTGIGYLVPAKCYAPHVPDLTGIKTSGGDWQSDALAEVMGDADLVGDVVDQWFKHGYGRKTIVFASNIAHSKQLCAEFERRGVAVAHIDGYMRDPLERETIIDDFRTGGLQVICNVAVLTKGFDAPECSCVVLARPTKSLMLHVQMVGRGLRIAPNKADCVILDHAGNVIRNGLPTDDLPSELDDGTLDHSLDRRQKDKGKAKDMPCSSCGFVSSRHKCPACGFEPEKRADVDVVDGELREITDAGDSASKRNRTETRQQKAEFYAGLIQYGRDKGYSSGWASHKYRERYGVWPNAHRGVEPMQPSADVLKFIQHLNIRHAKGRAVA